MNLEQRTARGLPILNVEDAGENAVAVEETARATMKGVIPCHISNVGTHEVGSQSTLLSLPQ